VNEVELLNLAPIAPHALVRRPGETEEAYQARLQVDPTVRAYRAWERWANRELCDLVEKERG
jgi:hypothetical protein